jgi:quercetin dioxygenase-like cupin family protein
MQAGRMLVLVGTMVAGAVAPGGILGQAADTPVPLFQEPRHHVVYDSPNMRIHDIQIPPGDTTLFHTHDTPILYVPIAAARTRSQVLGAEWSGGGAAPAASPAPVAPARPGKVNSVTTYVEKPYTHRVNNVGTSLFRLVGIANRTAGAAADTDDVSGLSPTPELVNKWYRAHRVALAAGESTPPHRHASTVVVVMQTAGTASSAAEGTSWNPLNGPGDIARHEGAGMHVVRNVGLGDVELMEIEVRGVTPR